MRLAGTRQLHTKVAIDTMFRRPYYSECEWFGSRKDTPITDVVARPVDDPTDHQSDHLLEEAVMLLPEVGKCLFASIMRHPSVEGLTVPQIKALGFLGHNAPCTVGELANGLGIAMATASEAVDRLVERALIERQANPADRRRVMLALDRPGSVPDGRPAGHPPASDARGLCAPLQRRPRRLCPCPQSAGRGPWRRRRTGGAEARRCHGGLVASKLRGPDEQMTNSLFDCFTVQ